MIGAQRRTIFDWFVHSEVSGSVVLLACTLVALAWANSPWAGAYFALAQTPIALAVGTSTFALSLQHWVNDGLMAVFFFVVGLEIKRELSVGHLSSFRQAALPVAAALGGMIVPAAIYLALQRRRPGARGWGIPMATDIAFALGILALLGPACPSALKVFLTALAIADDLGAVLVIAFFYTERDPLERPRRRPRPPARRGPDHAVRHSPAAAVWPSPSWACGCRSLPPACTRRWPVSSSPWSSPMRPRLAPVEFLGTVPPRSPRFAPRTSPGTACSPVTRSSMRS